MTKDLHLAYGGTLNFTLGKSSGNFSSGVTATPRNLLCMESSAADNATGPGSNDGIRLCIRESWQGADFTGATTSYSFAMTESQWLQDPKDNRVSKWYTPSKCDFLDVISQGPVFKIYGNLTQGPETILFDDFKIQFGEKDISHRECTTSRPMAV